MQTAALLICAMVCGQGQVLDSASRDTLKFIDLNYKANLEAFRFGEFEFEFLYGNSASGVEPLENPFSAKGYYAFDDTNAVYHCVYDDATIIARTRLFDGDVMMSGISPRRMLWDGESTVLDFISPKLKSKKESTFLTAHTAEVFDDPDGSRFMGQLDFPIFVGPPGKFQDPVNRDIDNVFNGRAQFEELSTKKGIDGADLVDFTFRYKGWKRTYTIDLKKSSLPLEVVDFNRSGAEAFRKVYEQIEFLEGAGWMPKRVVLRSMLETDTRITILKSCNVARKPALAKFSLDFDVPLSIVDQNKQIKYTDRTTFSLLNRPRLGPGAKRFKVDRSMPPMSAIPEMPGELPPPSHAIWYAVFAGSAACLLLIGIGYSRYRKGVAR